MRSASTRFTCALPLPVAIVGVMPKGFRLPVNDGLWAPLVTAGPRSGPAERSLIRVFGRLAPGLEATAAEAELAVIGERMIAEYPQFYERPQALVAPYVRHLIGVPAWYIWLAQLFAALILTAVAVNVGVLFYARTALRRGEITVRTALGASRSRIVTQLFLEALALSAVAAALGLLIAQVGFRQLTLVRDFADGLPYWFFGGLPPETIAYAAGLAVFAALVVGVLPALQATGRHLESTLREMGGGTGLRMGRTWTVLICVQVAVAVGVLPAVVAIAWNYSPPPTATFPASEILSFTLRPQPPPLGNAADSVEAGPDAAYGVLQAELLRRVEAIPEVSGVTFASAVPGRMLGAVRIEVEGPTSASELTSRTYRVDVEYFGVFGASLLAGRTFVRADAVDGATAAVVNRAFVDEYLVDLNATPAAIRAGYSAKSAHVEGCRVPGDKLAQLGEHRGQWSRVLEFGERGFRQQAVGRGRIDRLLGGHGGQQFR